MKLIISALLISTSLFAAADCEKAYRFSNRSGDGAVAPNQEFIAVNTSLSATTGIYDVRATGCSNWIMTYDNEGFSGLSIQLENAPSANGAAGTFVAYAGTGLTGNNPSTTTTSASYSGYGYFPYIRVNLTSVTGTGSINVTLRGWKSPAYIAASSNSRISAPQILFTDFICNATTTVGAYACTTNVGVTETYFTNSVFTLTGAATANTLDGKNAGLHFTSHFDLNTSGTGNYVLKLNACSAFSGGVCTGRVVLWFSNQISTANIGNSKIDCDILATSVSTTVWSACTAGLIGTYNNARTLATSVPNSATGWILTWSLVYGSAGPNNNVIAQVVPHTELRYE